MGMNNHNLIKTDEHLFSSLEFFFLNIDGTWSWACWQPQFKCLRCPVGRRHQLVTGANAPDSNHPGSDLGKRQTTICRRSRTAAAVAKRNTSCDASTYYLGDAGGGGKKKALLPRKTFCGRAIYQRQIAAETRQTADKMRKVRIGGVGGWDKTGGSTERPQRRHTEETQGEMTFQSPSWLMWCVCVCVGVGTSKRWQIWIYQTFDTSASTWQWSW